MDTKYQNQIMCGTQLANLTRFWLIIRNSWSQHLLTVETSLQYEGVENCHLKLYSQSSARMNTDQSLGLRKYCWVSLKIFAQSWPETFPFCFFPALLSVHKVFWGKWMAMLDLIGLKSIISPFPSLLLVCLYSPHWREQKSQNEERRYCSWEM